jgi:hypothetical protein
VFTRMRQVIMPDADYTGFVDATDGFDGGDGQVRRNHACWAYRIRCLVSIN